MYTDQSLFCEILKNEAAKDFLKKAAPDLANSPNLQYMASMSMEQLKGMMPAGKKGLFDSLLDAANGKEVHFTFVDPKTLAPEVEVNGELTYDIDDVDGSMYMLEHRFSGCVVVRFSKKMDETVYGKVTCEGRVLPEGVIKSMETAGGIQMCGIPVRSVLIEYDKEYRLVLEGFRDMDGICMKPQEITVRTLPKPVPDPAYAEHDAVALRAAREGIVLLKNEGGALPLAAGCHLNVVGADSFRVAAVGAGRINPRYSFGLKRALSEDSSFVVDEAASTALIVISRPSGENFDNNAVKGEFYLSDEEEKQIAELCSHAEKVIAVVNSGYPMDLRWADRYGVAALLWCGFPGMLGGKALVEILDGRVNPSGKLPDTWSLTFEDIPSSANFYQPKTPEEAPGADTPVFIDTCYEEDIYVGYRYFETFDKPVAYPFGFGLSYTSFEVKAQLKDREVLVKVTNTGSLPGAEVVQVYAAIPEGKLEQPSRRLVGFARTKELQPKETQELTISIGQERLTSYDEEQSAWIMEKGRYAFYAGTSVKDAAECGAFYLKEDELVKETESLMAPPVKVDVMSRRKDTFPKGLHSGPKTADSLEPLGERRHYDEEAPTEKDFVDELSVEELARLSVCASHGWGMHEKGEAGRIFRLEKYDMPRYTVADGNNGVNIHKPNIGMPCSNTVCASWDRELAYEVGRVIAEEAKENDIQMILAPAMNLHRNPLNGRHPEYYSEDPYLAGMMAGHQSRGLEENGVSSCIKHVIANNCEAARKRNHSIMTQRALRELYAKVFEVAMSVHQPDSMMTAYNAVNGCFTAQDEELIQGLFRKEFGFKGFVMTDWNSYDTADVASAIQAGNCWMTPGTADDTYVKPILQGVKDGRIDVERLRSNVRYMLRVVQKRTGKDLGVAAGAVKE